MNMQCCSKISVKDFPREGGVSPNKALNKKNLKPKQKLGSIPQ